MTQIKETYSTYSCDFCEDECPNEMFSCEESWERTEDDKDRCVACLIKDRDYWKKRALEAESQLNF